MLLSVTRGLLDVFHLLRTVTEVKYVMRRLMLHMLKSSADSESECESQTMSDPITSTGEIQTVAPAPTEAQQDVTEPDVNIQSVQRNDTRSYSGIY